MCTLSQGLIQEGYQEGYQTGIQAGIEAGRNQVLLQLEAAKARTAEVEAEKADSDSKLRLIISAFRAQGASLEDISRLLGTPIEALQKFLLQDTSESKPPLH